MQTRAVLSLLATIVFIIAFNPCLGELLSHAFHGAMVLLGYIYVFYYRFLVMLVALVAHLASGSDCSYDLFAKSVCDAFVAGGHIFYARLDVSWPQTVPSCAIYNHY